MTEWLAAGLLTRGSPSRRLPGRSQWHCGRRATPLTAAGPSRTFTGFPHRSPIGRNVSRGPGIPTIEGVERKEVSDRQLEALLERLDRLTAEVHQLNRRLDSGESLAPVVHELRALNESLTALAYAALAQAGPQVRRRRAS